MLAVYAARTASNAVGYLIEHVLEDSPIQRVWTDRGGKMPIERFFDLSEQTPFYWEVEEQYDFP